MTPREFYQYTKGWAEKEKQLDRRMAWAMANIINPWVKKSLKPSDFLKGDKPPLMIKDKAEFMAHMNKLRGERKKKRAD